MRHTDQMSFVVKGTRYDVSPKLVGEVEALLRKVQAYAYMEAHDLIPIEVAFPDINHPVRGPANYLRGIRSREGLTQTQLAKKTGIKQSHISEMERYKRVIGKATAKKLAAVLNCNWRSMVSE